MRNFCWLWILALALFGCAGLQQVPEKDRTFEQVYDAPGMSKDRLFEGSKIWIAQEFASAKAVIEYENKADGAIIGNGIIPYPCSGLECISKSDWKVSFTMRVDTKENRFRLSFSNLRISWPSSYTSTFGARSGGDISVSSQGDMRAIQPILLNFGKEILASVAGGAKSSNW